MNVAGFEENFGLVRFSVHVASISGLTLLKLVAWLDRGRETNKDAADLYRLHTANADAGNTDRLYDHEMDLLEAVSFDIELAGAELLRHDVARLYRRSLGVSERANLVVIEAKRCGRDNSDDLKKLRANDPQYRYTFAIFLCCVPTGLYPGGEDRSQNLKIQENLEYVDGGGKRQEIRGQPYF
jgi:predicted nucleotidyltransferase